MKIKDARSLPSVAQEDIRIKCVKAVLDGMKQVKVAKIFGVTRQAVGKWLKAYREGDFKALKAKRRGRRRGGKLLPWQAAQIAKTVIHKQPEQLKLPYFLWTRDSVAGLITARFGLELSRWTVGRHLKRWGFTPQKSLKRAYEQYPDAVDQWLNKEYPAIRAQAKQEQATIYWGDEMGLRSDDQVGRTYGRKGKTPAITMTGKRFSCNMISAITNQGQLNFMIFKERFNTSVFLKFLRRLIRQSPRKVFLIVDRHPAHASGRLKKWTTKHRDDIRLFYLPSYSPELNPDELVNQDVKTNTVRRCRPSTLKGMLTNVRSYLYSRQRTPKIVKRYFEGKYVQYAAS